MLKEERSCVGSSIDNTSNFLAPILHSDNTCLNINEHVHEALK